MLVATGSYHGAVPWCTPSLAGVTAEDRAHILHYEYNDVASLERAADQAGRDLAAVVVTAFRHDVKRRQEAPTLAFAQAMRRICDAADAALIIDDVRAGFRIHPGGSWEPYGVRPDLSAFEQGDRQRPSARRRHRQRSFPRGGAAGLCHRFVLVRGDADGGRDRHHQEAACDRCDHHHGSHGSPIARGLQQQARTHDLPLRQTGPVQMPLIMFDDDPDFVLGHRFVLEALQRGVYLHPWHNMFLSAAHQADDIDRVLEATDGALKQVAASVDRRQLAKAAP